MCFIMTKAEEAIFDVIIRWMTSATNDDTKMLGLKFQTRLTPLQQMKAKQVLSQVRDAIGDGCGV